MLLPQVAAGDGFTVALADDGSVWACGTFKDDVGSLSKFSVDEDVSEALSATPSVHDGRTSHRPASLSVAAL